MAETLRYAAEFRLSSQLPAVDKAARVDSVLDELGLRSAADTKIGNAFIRGVSGGQKRRVSIGIELIAQPSILFLDVPTSGLDSTAALSLTKTLRGLATRGNMVVRPSTSRAPRCSTCSTPCCCSRRAPRVPRRQRASSFFREQGLECHSR